MESYLFSLVVGVFDTVIVFLFFVAVKGVTARFHSLGRGWIYAGAILAASISSFPLPAIPLHVKMELFGKFAMAGIVGVYSASPQRSARGENSD